MTKTYPQTGFTPPPGSTLLTLVRHGQSQAAEEGKPFPLMQGHGDPPLTELGHHQGEAVGQRLANETFDAMYATTLVRTQQTAAPLAKRLGMEVNIEHDLREVFLGDWDGGLFRQMAHEGTHPAILEMRKTGDYGACPGAESNAELTERCVAAVNRIHEAHVNQHVVAFVHGGVIGALVSQATRGPLMGAIGADNGSIHRLCLAPDRWILRAFNDTNHLAEVGTPPLPT